MGDISYKLLFEICYVLRSECSYPNTIWEKIALSNISCIIKKLHFKIEAAKTVKSYMKASFFVLDKILECINILEGNNNMIN